MIVDKDFAFAINSKCAFDDQRIIDFNIRKVLDDAELDVKVEKLKDASLASMMTMSEEGRRMQEMMKMYAAYGMNFDYDSVMAYYNAATADDYEKVLQETAEETCLNNMAYQDLAAQAGITVTDEQYDAFITENEVSEESQETYGKGYLIQQYILPDLVKDYIAEHATVE